MSTESQIVADITSVVHHNPSWVIGITSNPIRCKQRYGNPSTWRQWDAVQETSARAIENLFLKQGMQSAPCGDTSPHYVYIFRLS